MKRVKKTEKQITSQNSTASNKLISFQKTVPEYKKKNKVH